MSNAWRATAFLGVFFFVFGFQLPYLPLWLEQVRGLTGAEISAVMFGAMVGRFFTGPIISAWADARTSRGASLCVAIGACLGYILLAATSHTLMLIMAGFAVLTIVHAIPALGEVQLLLFATDKHPRFGEGRAFATFLFAIGVLSGGVIIDQLGIFYIVPALIVGFFGLTLMALLAPKLPLGRDDKSLSFTVRLKRGMQLYRRPTLFFLLISTSLIQAAHGFYYGFSTVVWEKQALSGTFIGILWVMGVVGEIILLCLADRLPQWVTPQRLILVGGLASLLRWSLYAMAPSGWELLVLQNLHALTFAATFLGAMKVIHRDVDKQDQALAVSLLASLTGAFTGIAGLISGVLYDRYEAGGYFAMTALSVVAIIFACMLMFRISTRPSR